MNRALLWKELRTQRPILLSGLAFAMLAPLLAAAVLSVDEPVGAFYLARSLPGLYAALWPFLALAGGAITFATEAEDGTERFLLSRPVSRARVWWVKVGVGVGTVVATSALVLLSLQVTAAVIGPPPSDYRIGPALGDATLFGAAMLTGVGTMLFACGVLCSTLLPRPLTAAAAAVALAPAVVAVIFALWSILGLVPQLEPHWLGAEIFVVALVLLMASLRRFTWSERLAVPGSSGSRLASRTLTAGGALLVLASVVLPALFAVVTPRPGDSRVVIGSTAYGERAVVMAMRDQAGTTQTWKLMADGRGLVPLAGRHTSAPRWARGDSVVYYSRRGAFGGGDGGLDLFFIDASGSRSWRVYPDMPGVRELFFYGSNVRGSVAFRNGSSLTVAKLSGYGYRTFELSGLPLESSMLLGFNNGRTGEELLFVGGNVDPSSGALRDSGSLYVYELESETSRELRRFEAGTVLQSRMRNRDASREGARGGRSWRSIHVIATERDDDGVVSGRVERIDPVTGEAVPFFEIERLWSNEDARRVYSRCSVVELAPDRVWRGDEGRRSYTEPQVLFGDCSESARAEYPDGVIRLVGARSGHQVTWPLPAGWSGEIHRVFRGQRDQTVLLDIRGAGPGDSYAMALDQSGGVRTYPMGWTLLGWTSLDYFLLQREEGNDVSFAVGDARTGEVFGLYPDNELREVLRERLEQQRLELARAANATR